MVNPDTLTKPPVVVTVGVGMTIVCGTGRGDTTDTRYPVIALVGFEDFAVQERLITPDAPRTAVTLGTPGRG